MNFKKLTAAVCAFSMLASSVVFPKDVSAAEYRGNIQAFDRDSFEETRKLPKPQPSVPEKEPEWKEGNLALGKKAEASDVYGDWRAEYVTDGISDDASRALRWQSGENVPTFKNVWIWLDMERESILESLQIKFDTKMYGNFILETSDDTINWEKLTEIKDVPFTNDLHITYNKRFEEPLQAKRYVRLYFTDVNTNAGNKSISIRELELHGRQEILPEENKPKNAQEALDRVTKLTLDENGTQIVFPAVSDDYTIELKGSDQKQTISNDALVTNYNFYDYDVDVLVQAVSKENPTDRAEKNMVIHVPGKTDYYPELFPEVENPNAEPQIIPSVQEWYGYEGDFVLTKDTKIAVNDAAGLGLMEAAKNLNADLAAFTGFDLAITEGEGGIGDIELTSLESDRFDTGDEGYLLLNNENGLKIYAPSYTGAYYGTMSLEQVFYGQRFGGQFSFPKGILRDYPKFEVRGVMLDVARAPYRLDRLYDYAKAFSFYKMNEFHVHLNDNYNVQSIPFENAKNEEAQFRLKSDTFPSLCPDAKESEYYNTSDAFKGAVQYTKEEYIDFQKYAQKLGINVLSEIDTPGHALSINKYVVNHPDEAAKAGISGSTTNEKNGELLALSGANYENAAKLIRALFDEYLGIKNGVYKAGTETFLGSRVHIGADEYWNITADEKKNMMTYIEDMNDKVRAAGKTARIWGHLAEYADSISYDTASLNNIEIDVWSWNQNAENEERRIREGFKLVNVNDSLMYGNPGRDKRDVVNAEYLFESWTPYQMKDYTVKKGEPALLGAKTALWADINRMGVTERDINERAIRSCAIVAEKTWGGTDEDQDFTEFSFKYEKLGNGPRVAVAADIPSVTDMVADYDFANFANGTLYDISGNHYDAQAVNGKTVTEDGKTWMEFNGTTELKTTIDSLSYPYTVQFDIKADNEKNGEDACLFDGYDGRLSADKDGALTVDRAFFHQTFGYQLPANEAVNITLVGTQQVTKLYVNGVFQKALLRSYATENDYKELMGTFVFPLKSIGKGFHGKLADIKAYKKAMNAQEVKASYENAPVTKVNVSQHKGAAGELRAVNEGNHDSAEQKLPVAWKAVDGDGNSLNGTHAPTETERNSYFNGKNADSFLALDLYRTYDVSEIHVQFDNPVSSYKLYRSDDGKTWTELGTYKDTTVTFDAPVNTQYLKLAANGFKLREIEVYEKVDKGALNAALKEAEILVKDLSFADKKDRESLFDAYMQAVSASENAYALQGDVDAAVKALLDAGKDFYKITVDGKPVAAGKYNTKVVLKTPETNEAGEKFAGWQLDGKTVSLNPEYMFFIANNADFTTLYVPETETVEAEASALVSNVIVMDSEKAGKKDVRFVAQLVVPNGMKLTDAGLVWSNKNISAIDQLTVENADDISVTGVKITRISKISTSYQFSVTIKGVPAATEVPGRIFAQLKDAQDTVYSDVVIGNKQN